MVPVKKKTKIAILIASLAVFALVLAAALLLSRGAGSDRVQSGEHPLRISEYMRRIRTLTGASATGSRYTIRPISHSTFPATAFRTT